MSLVFDMHTSGYHPRKAFKILHIFNALTDTGVNLARKLRIFVKRLLKPCCHGSGVFIFLFLDYGANFSIKTFGLIKELFDFSSCEPFNEYLNGAVRQFKNLKHLCNCTYFVKVFPHGFIY